MTMITESDHAEAYSLGSWEKFIYSDAYQYDAFN